MDQLQAIQTVLGPCEPRECKKVQGAPFFLLTVAGQDAISTWQKLRARAGEAEFWPIVCGAPEDAERLFEIVGTDDAQPVRVTLEEADRLTPSAFLEKRVPDFPDADLHGEWPRNASVLPNFVLPFEILDPSRPKPVVEIAIVPVRAFWEVPAVLSFGGWNTCPDPQEHVVMMRHWSERYGAELVCLSFDTVEMRVARRPASRDEAMHLAWEQYLYCEDIVTQGVQTIEHLAATLALQDRWFFWWD